MHLPTLSVLLLATGLITAPATITFADPAPSAQSLPTSTASGSSDSDLYAAREAKAPAVATFHGGGETIVVTASAVTLLLAVLIVVILL